ncbi:hypothetical protein SELMODRAFT_139210 [Selaginella moellendorffii]|uniref:Thioesterase domain-containing protein n=1 Tax=Selaginella moellendorffii TaxID=88036 RepID=D8QPB1_SELML|nr:1,4-dihydroxy-2-naphthoyl-CoA thioesterase 1 [Selaginella moellendorffii]XP_024525084.1 1,4-dihydroxy-2-naphthoyl-CoA thioesterase 1 [Selaginella moellendorffii]EFJ37589.1 hypothetical protein SELMODRAFT_139210 [Selaginella moellendorffii]|eukprot:XP_002960050.1 1,4-dihydroxy-2-naphthoyl-CoA thioesterase 1 [Selaginella moellendorffii]
MEESSSDQHISGLAVLDYIGFKLTSATPEGVHGTFVVSRNSCQPFGVLHGGVSAFIAEAVASMGAQIASKWERVAGIELNINHLRAVPLGHRVTVDALPLLVGRRIQVWEVKLWAPPASSSSSPSDSSSDPSSTNSSVIAVSRVTLVVGLPNASKGAHFKDVVAARAKL